MILRHPPPAPQAYVGELNIQGVERQRGGHFASERGLGTQIIRRHRNSGTLYTLLPSREKPNDRIGAHRMLKGTEERTVVSLKRPPHYCYYGRSLSAGSKNEGP